MESNERGRILPLKHLSVLSFANVKASYLTRFRFENIMPLRLVKCFNTALSVVGPVQNTLLVDSVFLCPVIRQDLTK